MKKTDFIIDPEFVLDLQTLALSYIHKQQAVDRTKWKIAAKVNDMWSEHKNAFSQKIDYYAECSRAANSKLSIAAFGDSGQTMRRWCEVQATYENFPQAELLLEETSFKHLEVAKRAANQEKAESPIAAMDWALAMRASAEDMQEHYFPTSSPTEYDRWSGAMLTLLDLKNYEWIQSAQVKEQIFTRVKEIESIKKDYLEQKGMAE